MFGPVRRRIWCVVSFTNKIVRHKPGRCILLQLLDHRMPPLDDLDHPCLRRNLWAAILARGRQMRKAGKNIHFSQCQRRLTDTFRLSRNRRPQLCEETPLDFDDLLLCIENLRLVFLQLRRREALCVHQRLLALVVGGGEMQIAFEISR